MNIFSLLISPTTWILKLIWKIFKKYALLALILAYIFRGPLFSGRIARYLEGKIYKNTGICVKIEKFSGTYFTSVCLKNIQLQKDSDKFKELKIEEIYISYNILAPIFGERILQKIAVKNPTISVIGAPSPSDTRKINLESVDIPLIIQNSPNIEIIEANLSYEVGKQKISVERFTLKTTPKNGRIGFGKLILDDSGYADKRRELSGFNIAWKFDKKILNIHELNLSLPGYMERVSIVMPIEVDLSRKDISLEKINIQLANGSCLKGYIDINKGCHLELDHLRASFPEVSRLVSLFYDKQINPCDGELNFSFVLDFPEWDITRLNGVINIRVQKKRGEPETVQERSWKPGLVLRLNITDLGIIEDILHSLGVELEKLELAGNMGLESQFFIKDKYVTCEGEFDNSWVMSKFMPRSVLKGNWEILSYLDKKRIHLKELFLKLGDIETNLQGELVLSDKPYTWIKCRNFIPDLRPFLPSEFQDQIDASIDSECDIKGYLAGKQHELNGGEISGQNRLKIRNLRILEKIIGEVYIKTEFVVNRHTVVVPSLVLKWKDRECFSCSGSAGLNPGDKFNVKGELKLQRLEEYIEYFFPDLRGFITGDLRCGFDIEGVIPKQGHEHTISGKVKITCTNGVLMGNMYKNIEVSADFNFSGGVLKIDESRLIYQGERLLDIRGVVDLVSPKKEAEISCHVSINDLERIIPCFSNGKSSPLSGALETTVRLKGMLSEILEAKSPIHTEIDLTLTHGKFQDILLDPLRITIHSNIDREKSAIDSAEINLNHRLSLSMKGVLGYSIKTLSKIQMRCIIPSLQTLAPCLQPFITGKAEVTLDASGYASLLSIKDPVKKLDANIDLSISDVAILKRKLDSIQLKTELMYCERSLKVHDLTVSLDKEHVLSGSGFIGLSPDELSSVQFQIALNRTGQYLNKFADLGFADNGTLMCKLSAKGYIFSLDRGKELNSGFSLALNNMALKNEPLPELLLDSDFRFNDHCVTIDYLNVQLDKTELLNISGKFCYKGKEPTNLKIHSRFENMLNFLGPKFLEKDQFYFKGESLASMTVSGHVLMPENKVDLDVNMAVPLDPSNEKKTWELKLAGILISGSKRSLNENNGLELGVKIKGPLAKPDIQGYLSLFLERIRFSDQELDIKNFSIRADAREKDVLFHGKTYIGGAELRCDGQIRHNNGLPLNIESRLYGKRILFIRTEDIYGRADINLFFKGVIDKGKDGHVQLKGKVSGEIDVNPLNITRSISLNPSPERVFINPGFESPFLDLYIDISILLTQIRIHNNFVIIETQGKIWTTGNIANPEIKGWIKTTSGKLFLPQGVMNITECLITLKPQDPLMPYINIKAETRVQEYRIFVIVQGRLDDFTIDFMSSPPLSKEDIVSLLLTGVTRGELTESGGKKLTGAASSMLLQQFLNSIGVGSHVSAQVSEESATVTVSPDSWHGIALQGKVDSKGKVRFSIIYRLEFK